MTSSARFTCFGGAIFALGVLLLTAGTTVSARADDTPPAPTDLKIVPDVSSNSVTDTNVDLAEQAKKDWKTLYRATQPPMQPPEWTTNQPTKEDIAKYYLPILHKGIDLARDFYKKYPNDPKAASARRKELELINVAVKQFDDTNLVPRLEALEWVRLNDPNATEDEKFKLRAEQIQKLLGRMPDVEAELVKKLQALHKDYPDKLEVYQFMVLEANRSKGEMAEAMGKQILESSAPEEIKQQVRFTQRSAHITKLLEGLPATGDELDKAVRALPKDFPNASEPYSMMFLVLARSDMPRAETLAKDIEASDAPDVVKDQARRMIRQREVQKLVDGLPGTKLEFEESFHALIRDFPHYVEPYQLLVEAIMKSTGADAKRYADELNASTVPAGMKAQVAAMLKQGEWVGKPMQIRYTAVDGREVDISQMKGKVVLVDFWATWCGPCMAELPNVKAAYAKLHEKGFEIVGVSLDESKTALLKTLKEKEMTWPQYLGGSFEENKFAKQYGIMGIPSMWLVDKNGILRDINARGALEEKVTQLLAE